ncbi:MAG: sodium:solute symporter family protein [Ignavibacteriales bacterium]
MALNLWHWIGMIATISSVTVLGLYAGRRVKSAGDFLMAGRSMGPALVAGSMLGTILGGSSTIGTVELAFKFGVTAIWWTLGSGIGCLVFGLTMYRIVRQDQFPTVGRFLARSYGGRAGRIASLVLAIALFLAFITNVLSALAVLSTVSGLSTTGLGLVAGLSIAAYVALGGLWGTSMVGLLKICLIAVSLILSTAAAWMNLGDPSRIITELPAFPWRSLFGRGVWVDVGSGVGIALGLLSTQMYIQALAGARSDAAARGGAFISAVLAPVCGSMGVFIGLSMKLTDPGVVPSQALPLFVVRYLPAVLAGSALGTFFVAAVGTAAGVALSISSIVTNDLLGLGNRSSNARLGAARVGVFAAITAGVAVACSFKPPFILQLSIVSMGIRASCVAPAFLAAVAFGKRISPAAGTLTIACGSAAFAWAQATLPRIDPVLPALAVSVASLALATLALPGQAGTSSGG